MARAPALHAGGQEFESLRIQIYSYSIMWYVYVLECSNWRYYIWSTKNIDDRMQRHQTWRVKSTKNILPIKLVYYRRFNNIQLARKIEYMIKQKKNRWYIEYFMDWGSVD